jgi:multidrug resistance efflux pump
MPMTLRAVPACLLALATTAAVATPAPIRPVLIAGEVVAIEAQPIVVPQSSNSPVVLRTFVADGTEVRRGNVVLRIDPGQTTMLVSALRTQIDQARARHARGLADLEVAALDVREALVVAEANLARARIDAAIPADFLSALDRDRYAGALEKAEREVEVRRRQLAAASAAIDTQRRDATLEIDRLTLELGYNETQVRLSEVRAEQDGVVVQGFSPWGGRRISEGESVQTGTVAGELIGAGGLAVRAWALEADRQRLEVGMPVRLRFDALPDLEIPSAIAAIAGAPEARAAWGAGRYFRVDVPLPEGTTDGLVPGMSALLQPAPDGPGAAVPAPAPAARLELDGELVSREVSAIAPPAISEVFQFTIAQLAPEGASVRAGQPVAVFEAPGLADRLPERRNQREEKLTQQRQMQLAHAEAERADALAVAEAESLADKAARKATQPEELVRRVDYQKLVVDRELATTRARIAREREAAKGRARRAERAQIEAEIRELDREIAEIETGLAALAVRAPRDGVVVHRSTWGGEKFQVGNQVFVGLPVAEVADPTSLQVRAVVPEAQAMLVAAGASASVVVSGSGSEHAARVIELGRVFRTRSRTQPVIVRDVRLEFERMPEGLKPGAPVRVRLEPARAVAGATP